MSLARSVPALFEDLFVREYPRVVSVAYRITRDVAEAEDVAQEVFARFVGTRRANDAKASGWLHAAAAHTALNTVRTHRRRLSREGRADQLARALRSGDEFADPQQIFERSSDRERVRAALQRIASRDAGILALRYGGLTYAEIAAALQIGAAQVGTRLARAERALRRELEHE